MPQQGFDDWIAEVASGSATMSQRNMKWVEMNGGEVQLVEAATKGGVHLVKLTDDKGNELVAASQHPFRTLC